MKTFLFAVAFWSAILISTYFIALAVLEVNTSVVVGMKQFIFGMMYP